MLRCTHVITENKIVTAALDTERRHENAKCCALFESTLHSNGALTKRSLLHLSAVVEDDIRRLTFARWAGEDSS